MRATTKSLLFIALVMFAVYADDAKTDGGAGDAGHEGGDDHHDGGDHGEGHGDGEHSGDDAHTGGDAHGDDHHGDDHHDDGDSEHHDGGHHDDHEHRQLSGHEEHHDDPSGGMHHNDPEHEGDADMHPHGSDAHDAHHDEGNNDEHHPSAHVDYGHEDAHPHDDHIDQGLHHGADALPHPEDGDHHTGDVHDDSMGHSDHADAHDVHGTDQHIPEHGAHVHGDGEGDHPATTGEPGEEGPFDGDHAGHDENAEHFGDEDHDAEEGEDDDHHDADHGFLAGDLNMTDANPDLEDFFQVRHTANGTVVSKDKPALSAEQTLQRNIINFGLSKAQFFDMEFDIGLYEIAKVIEHNKTDTPFTKNVTLHGDEDDDKKPEEKTVTGVKTTHLVTLSLNKFEHEPMEQNEGEETHSDNEGPVKMKKTNTTSTVQFTVDEVQEGDNQFHNLELSDFEVTD